MEKREIVDRQKADVSYITDAIPIPGGDFILLNGTNIEALTVWDSKKKQRAFLLENLPAEKGYVQALISPNGKWFVAIITSGVFIWDVTNGKLLHQITERIKFLNFAGFAADSNY